MIKKTTYTSHEINLSTIKNRIIHRLNWHKITAQWEPSRTPEVIRSRKLIFD